jgi:hypothetical protein
MGKMSNLNLKARLVESDLRKNRCEDGTEEIVSSSVETTQVESASRTQVGKSRETISRGGRRREMRN